MKRVVNSVLLALTVFLVFVPLVFFVLAKVFHIQVLSADAAIVHAVFLFACIAGAVTSIENKQLAIEVLTPNLPGWMRHIVGAAKNFIGIAVLTAVFFASFPNIFAVIAAEDSVWGIPIRVLFLAMPLMYAVMLFFYIRNKKHIISSILGMLFGVFISAGSIAGILYYVFGSEAPISVQIFDWWIALAEPAVWPLIIILLIAALFGVPLFIIILGITYIAFSIGGGYVDVIPLETYHILTDTSIAAIPLFTIAGYLLAGGSAGTRLLEVAKRAVGSIRGGTVVASVIVASFFTAFTGASGVTILALGGILSLILTGSGYKKDDAESLITATGSIGILFPPSLAIIIYGVTNIMTVNIYDVFKGAFLPGVLLAVGMIIIGVIKDKNKARTPFSGTAFLKAFKEGVPELLLPIAIITVYFSGLFTLFQTAAFTVLFAFVLEVFVRKDFSIKEANTIILNSIPIAGGVLVIIGAAKGLAYFLIDANIPFILSDYVLTVIESKYVFLLLLNLLLLVVGCIMDIYSATLVVSPLIIPIAESFGIHPTHTAVIFLTNLSIGFLTPPIGMNLFIAGYTFDKPITKIIKGILPFLAVQIVILLLVTYVPWFSLVFVE